MNRKIMGVIFALLMVLALGLDEVAAAPVTVRVWTFLKPSGTTGREMALNKIITDFRRPIRASKFRLNRFPTRNCPGSLPLRYQRRTRLISSGLKRWTQS